MWKIRKRRIKVIKAAFDEELALEYGAKSLWICPWLKAGQVFCADYAKPDGFCPVIFKAKLPARCLKLVIFHITDQQSPGAGPGFVYLSTGVAFARFKILKEYDYQYNKHGSKIVK